MKALKVILTLSIALAGSSAFANASHDDCSQMSSGNQLNLQQPTNPSTAEFVKSVVNGPRVATQQIRSGSGSETSR